MDNLETSHRPYIDAINKSIYGELKDKYCDDKPLYRDGSKILDSLVCGFFTYSNK